MSSDLESVESKIGTLFEKLSALHVDVRVIKDTYGEYNTTVRALDKAIRGNGVKGLNTRVSTLEDRDAKKDKFVYIVIGALVSLLVSLILVGVVHVLSG